jgi:transcriptional regulator with XRE-family HTH domain
VEGDLQRTVGRNIRAHRKRLGESQDGYARSLPIHPTYLGGVERGERNLTLKSVERLAGLMGLEPLQLLIPADDLAPGDDLAPEEDLNTGEDLSPGEDLTREHDLTLADAVPSGRAQGSPEPGDGASAPR